MENKTFQEHVSTEDFSMNEYGNSDPNVMMIEDDENQYENNENFERFRIEPGSSTLPLENEYLDSRRSDLFESLIASKDLFKFPVAWRPFDVEFSQYTAQWKNGKATTDIIKKIILYKDMSDHIFVMNLSLENKHVGLLNSHSSSNEEVESAINALHKLRVGQGCASPISVHNCVKSF